MEASCIFLLQPMCKLELGHKHHQPFYFLCCYEVTSMPFDCLILEYPFDCFSCIQPFGYESELSFSVRLFYQFFPLHAVISGVELQNDWCSGV